MRPSPLPPPAPPFHSEAPTTSSHMLGRGGRAVGGRAGWGMWGELVGDAYWTAEDFREVWVDCNLCGFAVFDISKQKLVHFQLALILF